MTVLITGGGGFIGSHLTGELLDDGHDVIVVDSFCSSRRENVSPFRDSPQFTLLEQDVLEPVDVDADLDYVLHLASRASPNDYQANPVHTLRTNSEGTLQMLELAEEHGAKFLFSSTSEVYGDPEVHPQTEEYWGHVNPVGPRACYDEGKRFGEAAITSFAREHD
ncbi:MAG: NAD-dependent epimerase/dehydratase family protein, partial [Candidatus Nanohaloarchaea archaeon]